LTLLFSKGFDLLSERNSVPQKIGGINALQAWAGANPEMYPSVVLAMLSFVRQERSLTPNSSESPDCDSFILNKDPLSVRVTEDVQMALNVLRKNPTGVPLKIDLIPSLDDHDR
jgi:hypothetical protein